MYEGERVRLRAFDNSDLMPCLRFRNDYSVMRTAQGGILYPATADDVGTFMRENSSRASGAYQFAIETKNERLFIGQCGFLSVNWKNRVGEAAILIGEEAYRGKGYASACVRACVAAAQKDAYVLCEDKNAGFYERLGFTDQC